MLQKTTILLILLFCWSARVNAQLTRILYEPEAGKLVLGISNTVLFNNKIMMAVGSEPLPQPVGYPDMTFFGSKGYLLNEDGLVTNGQFQNGHYDPFMDIKLTPNGKLALVYQYPTGNGYGFLMPYKIWNGTDIESSEFIYPQDANIGSALRLEYGADGLPRAASFANAGYALVYHEKLLGFWETFQLTNFGTIFAIANTAISGNIFYLLARIETGIPQIILFKLDGNNLTGETVTTSSTGIHDLKLQDGILYALYSQGNNLVLSKKALAGTTWTSETTVTENLHNRASLYFDNTSTPYIAYRVGTTTNTALKVIKKIGTTWINIFSNNGLTFDATHWYWGRSPSVIQKGSEMFALYSDNYKVYQTNLSALPTGLATNNITATSIGLSWNVTNWATSYKIFRNGVEVGTSNTLAFTDIGLLPSTNYCYTFQACNAQGCTAISAPEVCAKTLIPFELTALNIINLSNTAGNNVLTRNCEKNISLKIKNTTNLSLNYGFKITLATGGLNVLFEQANITFAPNEEKTIDKNWVGNGTLSSAGTVFAGNVISAVGTYTFAVHACSALACPTINDLAPIASNYVRTATGVSNPQNYSVVAPAIGFSTAPATVAGEGITTPKTVNIASNTTWTLTKNQTWLTLASASGLGNASFGYTVEANDTGVERTAIVTAQGCGTTQTYTVLQQKKVSASSLLLPTLFTPNGDGKNDAFIVRGSGIKTIALKILNSKGNVVWQTNNLQEALETGWNADKMPDGVYLCNVSVTFENGESQQLNKSIQLLR